MMATSRIEMIPKHKRGFNITIVQRVKIFTSLFTLNMSF